MIWAARKGRGQTRVSKSLALEGAEGDQLTSPASLVTYSFHRGRLTAQAQPSLHIVMPDLVPSCAVAELPGLFPST